MHVADSMHIPIMIHSIWPTYEVTGLGLAAGCVVACPALFGGEAIVGGGARADAVEANAARTALTPVGGGAPANVTATLNGAPVNLAEPNFAGLTYQVGIRQPLPLWQGELVGETALIPAPTTTAGALVNIVGYGASLVVENHEANQEALGNPKK